MQNKIEDKIKSQSYIDEEMIGATFSFWYNDDQHIRSPFPLYIREQLTEITTEKFLSWASGINAKAKKEINDEILVEKFEEIIFEAALKLVLTEDEKLTINYPFLIRVGDLIKVKDVASEEAESKVIDRSIIKREDSKFMKVILENISSKEKWETEFELPE